METKKFNKVAQIGTTLTWVTAFLIVFFIVIIFLSSVFVMSINKSVFYGKDEIVLEKYSGDLNSQDALINILESRIVYESKDMRVKEMIENYFFEDSGGVMEKIKERIEDNFKENLARGEYYALSINDEKISNSNYESVRNQLIKRSSELILIGKAGRISVRFFAGKF